MATPVGGTVVVTVDTQVPTAPAAVTVTSVSSTALSVSWTAATDNFGVTGYRVERCQGAGCTAFTLLPTATTSPYSDTGLVAATSYSYRVRATDAAGNLGPYSSATATTVPPAPPTAPATVVAKATTTTQIAVTWTAATSSVGVTGYLVERCQWTGCATFAQVGTATSLSFADAALRPGTNYSYRVRAVDTRNSASLYSPVATVATLGGNVALVAAYAFDEGTGVTAGDSSLAGNSGTVVNATWTAGRAGGALSFDGSTARVTVRDAASLHLGTALTLEAWVNPATTVTADWNAFIYKGLDTYVLASYPSGVPLGAATVGSTLVLPTGAAPLAANKWTHLATTYNGTSVRLYVNGVLISSLPATGVLAVSTNPLELGGSLLDGGAFAGLLDDVRVYNTALTATQIRTDMATPVVSR
jgi:chitodextrinase